MSGEFCQQSRTLLVEGPEDMISWGQVMTVQKEHMTFDLVDGQEQNVGEGRRLVRLEFSQVGNTLSESSFPYRISRIMTDSLITDSRPVKTCDEVSFGLLQR